MKSLFRTLAVLAVLSFAAAPAFAAESTDPDQHVKPAAAAPAKHHHKKHKKHKKAAAAAAEKKADAPAAAAPAADGK